MSDLERIDPKAPAKAGPTTTVFCDRCRSLKPCRKVPAGRGGVEWLCETCLPNVPQMMRDIVAHSPPPRDPAPSPAVDQWIQPEEPPDLNSDVPAARLDLEIDQMLAAADELRDAEPIGPERGRVPDDDDADLGGR